MTRIETSRLTKFAGVIAASTMIVTSLVAFAPSSGAATYKSAGESAFCKTIFTFHPIVPKATSVKSYKTWAKSLEPFYAKLASEAPNAGSKRVLDDVVSVLKDYDHSGTISKLDLAIAKDHAKWLAGTKTLANAIIACGKALA
jgi:hypothetical protein